MKSFLLKVVVKSGCFFQVNVAQEMENIGMDVDAVTNTSDIMNNFQYTEIDEISSFELERNDIRFGKLLGSGNFGEVYKATMGLETVAVKCLKGKNYNTFDCTSVVNNQLTFL